MLEFDPTVRTALTTDRVARLAADYGEPRRRHLVGLRRWVGLRLVAVGLRLAEPCPQGTSSAAYSSVR